MTNLAYLALETHARLVDVDDCDGICSVDDFLAHIPVSESPACREFPQSGKPQFRVFWHPAGSNEPDPDFHHAVPLSHCCRNKQQSVQEKIKCLLLSMNFGPDFSGRVFIQFWIHKKNSSGPSPSMLSVLGQPLGMGSMDNRFCRYRYRCMQQEVQVEDSIAGPVGRVFTRGYPEYSEQMKFYSREDFPMRCAKISGQYLALPIFEHHKCIGVLEFLATTCCGNFQISRVTTYLECIGLSCTRSHPEDCYKVQIQVRRNLMISTLYKGVLHFVRVQQKLPLIQIWIPCFCDKTSSVTRLFCRWKSWSSYCDHTNGWHSVENGKGLVGRAYSQKKSCFLGDMSQFSISEYPLVHFTQTHGLTACFAIPVQSLDPRLHDLILEVFLPPQKNSDHGNIGLMLQSLLYAMAQNHHRFTPRKYSGVIPFKLEENKEFCVQYSHSDSENFVYYDVSQQYRHMSTCKALENGRDIPQLQPSQKEDNYLANGTHVAPINRIERSRDYFANGDAESIDGEQVQSHEILGSSRIKEEQHSLPDHSPATESNSDFTAQEMAETLRKFAESAVKFNGRLAPPKRNELLNIQSATKLQETDFIEVGCKVTSQEHEMGMLPNERPRENDSVDANFILASAKNTSIATVVEEPGMGMCSNKRARENDATDANSVSTGAIGKAGATGNDEIACCMCNKKAREDEEAAAARSTPLGNAEIDKGHSMINVMATYKDDTILFPLSCNSGIKELRMELDDAFQFGAEKFKVKYKHDDGTWITLLRDKDFRFHVETLKESGQSTVKLSVFSVSL